MRNRLMTPLVVIATIFVLAGNAEASTSKGYERQFNNGHIAGTKCEERIFHHPAIDGKKFTVVERFTADGSYYGNKLFHNRDKMAAGTKLHECDATVVAFNKYPLGTILRITNPNNKKQVITVIQDRGGPLVTKRPDLARRTFEELKDNNKPAEGIMKNLQYEVLLPIQ